MHQRDEDPEAGLSQAEAERRLAATGPNRLPEPKLAGPLRIFARQFLNPFIYILIVAGLLSLVIGQLPSAIFIAAVLLLNAVIGAIQEYSAQKSASALRRMVRGTAHVIRDGLARTIDVEALVPGDLVLLASGDKTPADIRLIESRNLAVDESMLTGESLVVTKAADAPSAPDAPLAERFDRCFAGSIVTRGRARGVVEATGLKTQIGSISKVVSAARKSEPPLMIRVRRFTYQVAAGILGAIALLVALMLLKGGYDGREMALMSVGLAVSAIPEGLPAALTVALAIGMARMAERSVIIRKLVAVEALGSCTFICSDKTGTLTVNELTVRKIALPGGSVCEAAGEGVGPGAVDAQGKEERLREICVTGVLANESYLDYSGGEWVSDGDIVDVAFLVLAKKLGLSLREIRERERRLDLIPYESERALSGSLTRQAGEDGASLHVKGSPEKMLALSTHMLTEAGRVEIDRAAIEAQFEDLAADGYRVIALARRESLPVDDALEEGGALTHLSALTFLGMVAMIDPIRPDAKEAVARCRAGGVQVAMVTGDHPATARAIARDLNLIEGDEPVVTGAQIRETPPERLEALIGPARVFARIEPMQKQTIVETFMAQGHFVAVTGDGVNDAPAMRRANAGVAMGKRGTDVAKEAADLIITDDKFSSIVAGIEQGRIVYNNIRKVIALLIATGVSALLLFFLTVLAGLPMPLTAVQLLWLNLVANGLQDVALAFEPKEGGELAQRPRKPSEPIFERRIVGHVLVTGSTMGLLAFGVFWHLNATGVPIEEARNLTLMLMVLFGNIHALSSRSETRSLFSMRLFANPFLALAVPTAQLVHIAAMYVPGLSDVLALSPIGLQEWGTLLLVALGLLAVEEAHKAALRRGRAR
ncbi:MAG: HAD-IC family P-type ATPase [Marivibrio sp.]|uniref:cation-translocating P-type ATPase n=1 Tax=Marivibrio sp. TaxID=2039719 RepID=UPI0032EDCBE2